MKAINRAGWTLFWILVAAIAIFLIAPTLISIPISFTETPSIQFPPVGFSLKWYRAILDSEDWRDATINSLVVATLTAVVSVVLGTLASVSLSRLEFRGKAVIFGILLTPLVTPVIVLSIGTYMVFSRWGISNSLIGLVIAHTSLATPFVIVSTSASLKMMNRNLELAGAGLGASAIRVFYRVTLPLILPGMVSGAIFAFITSWDEVVIATFLTDPETRTVPVLIWGQVRAELNPTMAAVSSILIVVSACGLLLSYKLRRQELR